MLSEQQQRIMGYFIEEAKDHLNTIEQGLLNLRATIDDPEMVNEVFRAAHSVKGGAAMLGLTSIQHTAHRLEDYFKLLKECQVAIDQKLETLLLRVYDTLQELLEQLQGPFGLTDDKAEAAMAEVEPVFAELNQHLSQLVAASGITPPEDVSFVTAAPAPEPVAAGIPLTAVTPEASALRFIFQNDIPARLREMLQLFKQADAPESRQQLVRLCQAMAQPGEQLDLPGWCQLLTTAEQAVGNSDISYRMLAPIVIKDIKRAQEQILAGDTNVAASADLLALLPADLPVPDPVSQEVTAAAADEFALFGAGTESGTEDLFDLPADESDLSLDFEPSFQEATEDDLALGLDLFEQTDESASLSFNQAMGPQVGSAELNSLADLFEGEEADLGLSWQEEILPAAGEAGSESLELETENDFSDLLFQENSETLVFDDNADDLSSLLDQSSLEASTTSDPSGLGDFDFAASAEPSPELDLDFSSFDSSDPGSSDSSGSTELDLLSFEDASLDWSANPTDTDTDTTGLDDLFSTDDLNSEESSLDANLGLSLDADPSVLGNFSDLNLDAEQTLETPDLAGAFDFATLETDQASEAPDLTGAFDFADLETDELNAAESPDLAVLQQPVADPWGEQAAVEPGSADPDLNWSEDPFAMLADSTEASEADSLFDQPALDERAELAEAPDFGTDDLAGLGFGTAADLSDLDLSQPVDLTSLGEETALDLNWEETLDSAELAEFHLEEPGAATHSAESFSAEDLSIEEMGLADFSTSTSELTDADFNQFADGSNPDLDLFGEAEAMPNEALPAELDNLFTADLTAVESAPAEAVNLAEFELPEDFATSNEVLDIAALAEDSAPTSENWAAAPASLDTVDLSIFDQGETELAEAPESELAFNFGEEANELSFDEPSSVSAEAESAFSDLAFDDPETANDLDFGLGEPSPESSSEPTLDFGDESGDLDFGLTEPSLETTNPDVRLDFGDESAKELDFGLTEPLPEASSDLTLDFGDESGGLDFGLTEPSLETTSSNLSLDFGDESSNNLDFDLAEPSLETTDLDLSLDFGEESSNELDFGLTEPSLETADADLSLDFGDESNELDFGSNEPSLESTDSDLTLDFGDESGDLNFGLTEPALETTDAELNLDFSDLPSSEPEFDFAAPSPELSDGDLGLDFGDESATGLDFGQPEPLSAADADLMLNFEEAESGDLSVAAEEPLSLDSEFNFADFEAPGEQTEQSAVEDLDFSGLSLETAGLETDSDLTLDFAAGEIAPASESDLGLDFGDTASSELDLGLPDLQSEPTNETEADWNLGDEGITAEPELSFDELSSGFDSAAELGELNFEASDSDLSFDLGDEPAQPQPSFLETSVESPDADLNLDFESLNVEDEPTSELDFGTEVAPLNLADDADLSFDLGESPDGESLSSFESPFETEGLDVTTGADDLNLFGELAEPELNFDAPDLSFDSTDLDLANSDLMVGGDPAALFESSDSDPNSDLNFDLGELESSEDADLSLDFDSANSANSADGADSAESLDFGSELSLDFGEESSGQTTESNLGDLDFGESTLEFGEPDLNFDASAEDTSDALDFGSDLDLGFGAAEPEATSDLDFAGLDWTADAEQSVTEQSVTEPTGEPDASNFDLGLTAGLAGLGAAAGFAAFREEHPAESDFDFGDFSAEPTELTDLDAASPEVNDLDSLDALLAETETAEPVAFDDLEAVLAEDAPSITAIHEAPDEEDDFADLEALLEDDSLPGVPPSPVSVPSVSTPAPAVPVSGTPVDDEFSDLEALLQDADQVLGGGASPARKSASTSARRPNRRGNLNDQTMRVSVKHLDNLNNLVGEMVVNRNSLEQAQERLRQFLDNLLYQVQQLSDVGQRMRDLYERSLLESSLLSGRRGQSAPTSLANIMAGQTDHATGHSFDALEMDRFTGFHTLSQEMIELIVRVRESASDIDFVVEESDQVTRNFRQITTQLQEGLTRSRMVPFSQTADRLPRGVRDNSLKYGKQAELIIEGRDTLIDKMIVELLYDPMTHLVNNAIAHGIETPEERIAAGKSPTGRITIRTFHQGNQTVISVSDDGAGINAEAVRAKALTKGLITATQAREMSRLDTYDLLFHHGFSTVDQVDDLRGRGVGLDVVRSNLNEIRGTINIDSTVGKGTTFTIRLPLTLSISKALCCISNRARIAFPMDGVEDMLDVPKERVQTDEQGRSCIQWRDQLLPFQPLSDLLRYNRILGRGSVYGGNQEEDMISIVVLRSAGNFLALQVDQVLGEQEIVIKQLEGPVPKPLGVAGATVLGDGRIMPIADVLELIDLWEGRVRREAGASLWDLGDTQAPTEAATKTEPTVLIVDDSITVRELLSMTFSKVGYRVEQARDGQEAWEKLRSGLPCDLVFCDIEMPRMDGLELLSRIQKDVNLSHLPIAMLTSRGADRHRQMAVQLGAKGYFTKPYLEEMLLDAAQRMLKGEVMVSS